jgi:hypothetical protein
MIPSVGRIVHYTLTPRDATQIAEHRARNRGEAGGEVQAGDVLPMLIVKVWGQAEQSAVNGQVMLDGNDSHWVQSACLGEGPGTFRWPKKDLDFWGPNGCKS